MKHFIWIPLLIMPVLLWGQQTSFDVNATACIGEIVKIKDHDEKHNIVEGSLIKYEFVHTTETDIQYSTWKIQKNDTVKHIFLKEGEYQITQTVTLNGASTTYQQSITVNPSPAITLNYSREATLDTVEMIIGQSVTVSIAQSYNDYEWFRKEGGKWVSKIAANPSYTTNLPGEFLLSIKDGNECTNEAPFWIITNELPSDDKYITIIVENNILTPNNDGINDVLFVKYLNDPDIYTKPLELYIYNRGGVLIYDTKDYENDWDGKDKSGAELSTGSYYYVAKSEGRRGKTGFIDIIRSE